MKMISESGTTYLYVNGEVYWYGHPFGDDRILEEVLDMIGSGELLPSSMKKENLKEV